MKETHLGGLESIVVGSLLLTTAAAAAVVVDVVRRGIHFLKGQKKCEKHAKG